MGPTSFPSSRENIGLNLKKKRCQITTGPTHKATIILSDQMAISATKIQMEADFTVMGRTTTTSTTEMKVGTTMRTRTVINPEEISARLMETAGSCLRTLT